MQRTTRTSGLLAAATSIVLLVSACGDDDSEPTATPTNGAGVTEESPTEESPTEESPTPTGTDDVAFPVTFSQLDGVATELTLDQAFLDALQAVQVEVSAVGPAEQDSAGGLTTMSFPITGGQATVAPDADPPVTGTIEHSGGLELTLLGQSVTFSDFVVDGETGQLTASLAGQQLPLLQLDPATAEITSSGDQVVISNDAGTLSPEAAQALSDQLNLPSLPSVELGSVQVTLSGSG